MSHEQHFEQMLQELSSALKLISSGTPLPQEKIEASQQYESYPALLNGIVSTALLLQQQNVAIDTTTYSANFCECVFEFQTTRGQWLIRKAPIDCSDEILKLLGQFTPEKLKNLGTEQNPYVLLDSHYTSVLLQLCHAQYHDMVRKYARQNLFS